MLLAVDSRISLRSRENINPTKILSRHLPSIAATRG